MKEKNLKAPLSMELFTNRGFSYYGQNWPLHLKVIIFGTSLVGENAYQTLCKIYQIVAFCDLEPRMWGRQIDGIDIILPERLVDFQDCLIIVACTYEEREAIKTKLKELQINEFIFYSKTPLEIIMDELTHRGVNPSQLSVLEVFGGDGKYQTQYYASLVKELDIWEIKPDCIQALQQDYPAARVLAVDSYQAVKQWERQYDFIVVDNFVEMLDCHCEHFDLFPELYQLCSDDAIMVLNVLSTVDGETLRLRPKLFTQEHLQCRSQFYGTDHPERMTLDELALFYGSLGYTQGFEMEWCFFVQRSFLYDLVIKLKKIE